MNNIYYLGLSGEHRCPLGYLFLIGSFNAPNFEKVGSILVSACASVCVSVRPSVRSRKIQARVLKFHMDSSLKNSLPVFFLVRIISPCRVMPL